MGPCLSRRDSVGDVHENKINRHTNDLVVSIVFSGVNPSRRPDILCAYLSQNQHLHCQK